ncbi:MAG: hypothetical protein ABI318_17315 [Chthoniobacteraceae bacterium]
MRLLAAILAGVFLAAENHAAPKPHVEDASAYDEREAIAKLQAMDIFPEMEKEGSDFANAVSTEVECLECEQPEFFKSPAWPLRVARKVAARFGMKPRTVAEIRGHVAKTFEVDDEAFRQVHGIQIVSASFTMGGESFDLTPQLAARVTEQGFAVDCDGSLAAMLTDESQFDRITDESDAAYWKRQRKLLAAIAAPDRGTVALHVTFEFQSEKVTVKAKEGERLAISEDGVVAVSKIAPAARPVRAGGVGDTSAKPARRTAARQGEATATIPERPKR